MLACSFEAAPSGVADTEEGVLETDDSTSTGAPASEATSTTDATAASVTSSGPSSDTTTTSVSTAGPTTSEGGATSDVDPSVGPDTSTGDAAPAMLTDDGLVARYFLNEAPNGTIPMVAVDSAEDQLMLPLDYGEKDMQFVQVSSNRGLSWAEVGVDAAPRASIEGTKFEGLEGVTTLTFEAVATIFESSNSTSRIIHIGAGGATGTVSFGTRGADQMQLGWNNSVVREWDVSAFQGTRHVLHVIIDTTAPNEASRARLLVDGIEIPPSTGATLQQDSAALVQNNTILALGNRDRDRSFVGILFYAAIYGVPLDDDRVSEHVSRLLDSDD